MEENSKPKSGDIVSLSLDDYGTLRIYIDNQIVAEVSDCREDEIEALAEEVLCDLGYDNSTID